MADTQDLQPTCEDYHSDESDGRVLETFHGRKSPNAANVSTKRSHPSDLDKEKAPAAQESVPTNVDVRSDSGYSSFTAATVSSTNSAPSANSTSASQRSPPIAPAPTPPPVPTQSQSPAPKTRRPTVSQPHSQAEQRQNSANSSPRPKLSRTASQSKPSERRRRPTITQDSSRPERTERRERRESKTVGEKPRRPELHHASQSARDVSYPSADQRSVRTDPSPAYYRTPPSPAYPRQSAYIQGPAVIQPSVSRPRASTTRQSRPVSYSGEPGPHYRVQGMPTPGMPAPYPSPPQEPHGPPPSSSAAWRGMPPHHYGMPMGPMGPMGHPMGPYPPQHAQTPGAYFPPSHLHNQTSPPYDQPQRPGMSSRRPSNSFGTRNVPPPVITQAPAEPRNPYSARYGGQPASATQPRYPAPLQIQQQPFESSESETESEDGGEYSEPDLRDPRAHPALMPPPKITRSKSKSTRERPPMRRPNTTQVSDVDRHARRLSQAAVSQSLVIDPSRERASRPTAELSRQMSVNRPPAPVHTQSDYVTQRAQIVVNKNDNRRSGHYDPTYDAYVHSRTREDAQARAKAKAEKNARAAAKAARDEEIKELEAEARARASHDRYQAEQQAERERNRQNRTSKVYYQPPKVFDSESEEEEESEEDVEEVELPPAPAPPRRRRPTDVDSRKSKERSVEPKTKRIESAAEDYISAQRGTRDPFADQVHRAAKRHSRVPSQPSHSNSSRSEGSDKQSQSNRTAVTSNGNDEIRLRVDASAPLSLAFNGDMAGRTLRMVPAENGMADIIIGGSREEDSTYHGSERGSERGALVRTQSRRQAEEMTEKSSRSSRSRRDERLVRDSRDDREEQRRPLRRRAATDYRT